MPSTLSPSQIQTYAANSGFSGEDLTTAQAIALAESSGNPSAIGDNGNSIGLFQINLLAHPEYAGLDLTDPQTNADAAYNIFQSAGGFSPWTTYNTGAYQDYLPDSSTVDGGSLVDLSAVDLSSASTTWIIVGGAVLLGLLWWMAE